MFESTVPKNILVIFPGWHVSDEMVNTAVDTKVFSILSEIPF